MKQLGTAVQSTQASAQTAAQEEKEQKRKEADKLRKREQRKVEREQKEQLNREQSNTLAQEAAANEFNRIKAERELFLSRVLSPERLTPEGEIPDEVFTDDDGKLESFRNFAHQELDLFCRMWESPKFEDTHVVLSIHPVGRKILAYFAIPALDLGEPGSKVLYGNELIPMPKTDTDTVAKVPTQIERSDVETIVKYAEVIRNRVTANAEDAKRLAEAKTELYRGLQADYRAARAKRMPTL